MNRHRSGPLTAFRSVALALALSACATVEPVGTSAPLRELGLRGQGPHAAVEVADIIQPGGPGTWAPGARWTEIVVRIENASRSHLIRGDVSLVSVTGAVLRPAASPLELPEMQREFARSREQAETAAKYTNQTLASSSQIAPGVKPSSKEKADSFASAVKDMAAIAQEQHLRALAARPAEIEAEVARRALAPGGRVGPGERIQGSVFFAYTPTPQKLRVAYEADGARHVVEVVLGQASVASPGTAPARPVALAPTGPAAAPPMPAPAPPPGPVAPRVGSGEADFLYTVRPGDTLGTIAARLTGNAQNWRRIAEYNGIASPAGLRVGAPVKIPKSLVRDPELR
jgi:LysM domain